MNQTHYSTTLRGKQVASPSCNIPDGAAKVEITLRPSTTEHVTDLGGIMWVTGMVSLTVSRQVRNGIQAGGLLNGLDMPPCVKTLRLTDTVKDAPPSIAVRMKSGLEHFHASGVDADTVETVCRASTRLLLLELTACPVQIGGLYLPQLRSISMGDCGLEVIPSNLDQLAPMLRDLCLRNNRIGSLRGIVFPPELTGIDLTGNHGIDVSGAQFPPKLVRLALANCHPITGLDRVSFPSGVKSLSISGNNLKTIDEIKFPPGLRLLCILRGNRIKDTSCLIRHAMRYQQFPRGPYWDDAQLRELMPRYFENQDRVKVLVSAGRIHRVGARSAVRELPADLLRVVLEFLAETPKLR